MLPVFIWLAGAAYAADIVMALFAPGRRDARRQGCFDTVTFGLCSRVKAGTSAVRL